MKFMKLYKSIVINPKWMKISYCKVRELIKEFNYQKNTKPKTTCIVSNLSVKYNVSKRTVYSYLKKYN